MVGKPVEHGDCLENRLLLARGVWGGTTAYRHMNIKVEMTEALPTEAGIYFMMLKDKKDARAAAVHVYENRMGRWFARPVASTFGTERPIENREGKVLFSKEPITFAFVSGETVLSDEHPV